MDGCKPTSSPVSTSSKLSKYDGEPLSDPTEYRSVVSTLQFVTLARPDIAFVVNQVCQFMHSPTTSHWTAVKRILRFLKGTIYYGMQFK